MRGDGGGGAGGEEGGEGGREFAWVILRGCALRQCPCWALSVPPRPLPTHPNRRCFDTIDRAMTRQRVACSGLRGAPAGLLHHARGGAHSGARLLHVRDAGGKGKRGGDERKHA